MEGTGTLPNSNVTIVLFFIWTFLIFTSYGGFQRFARITKNLTYFFLLLFFIITIFTFTIENVKLRENIWTSSNADFYTGQVRLITLSLSIL